MRNPFFRITSIQDATLSLTLTERLKYFYETLFKSCFFIKLDSHRDTYITDGTNARATTMADGIHSRGANFFLIFFQADHSTVLSHRVRWRARCHHSTVRFFTSIDSQSIRLLFTISGYAIRY